MLRLDPARAGSAPPARSACGTTPRSVHSATANEGGAIAWWRDNGFVAAPHRPRLEILDRVGDGDSCASGLLYALLQGEDLATAVEYGAAHGHWR